MTGVKSDEASLLTKRKPNLVSLDKDDTQEKTDDLNKKQKLGISSIDNKDSLISKAENNEDVNGTENISTHGDKSKDIEEDDDDDDDDDDEDEEDYEAQGEDEDEEDGYDDSDDDHLNGNAEMVDLKGKGIMVDEKGKGKLIEESEDSSEGGSESDVDSDLSDDPLAEVDLDNILPTRTRSRRRVVQPGIHISDNQGSKEDDNDDTGDN